MAPDQPGRFSSALSSRWPASPSAPSLCTSRRPPPGGGVQASARCTRASTSARVSRQRDNRFQGRGDAEQRGCIGRVRLQRWRRWRVRVCCAPRSSHRCRCASFAWWHNRRHKVPVDAGIRINVLVADILGQSARVKVEALIVGRSMQEVLDRKGRLQASWPVGWHLTRQQQERRQAQSRAHLQGQRLGQKAAVRVRPGCSTNTLRTQGQVRRADHPKRPQEVGGDPGPQDAAHHLCHAHQRQSLPGQAGGLRGVQRSAQRAAPLTGAGWRCTRCFQFGRMAIPRGVLCLLHNQAIRSPATPCARSRQPSLTGL